MLRAFPTIFALYVTMGTAESWGLDLSTYRRFHLGATLESVTKQVGAPMTEVKTLHTRPALIQELAWCPQQPTSSRASQDPVDQVLFSFSDRKLFQIVVVYNRTSTQGLTVEDIIERVSLDYGTAERPKDAEMIFPSMFEESAKVLARWEDPRTAVNFVRSAYQSTFGLILVSKELEPAAREASAEAIRLDKSEAPQREAEVERQKVEETRLKDAQSRRTNKPSFRP